MKVLSHRRHDLSDHHGNLLEARLPGRRGVWGGIARDNRLFVNAVFWILRTGSPWRDLPPDYGDWKNTRRRFCRWRDAGHWEKLLSLLIKEPDFAWLFIDASHVKVRPHAAGARGGNEGMGLTKGGSTPKYTWPWMRMACRCESWLPKALQRTAPKPSSWIEGLEAGHLIADRGYDSNPIIDQAREQGMQAQIPPRKHRKEQRAYDKHLYQIRHPVESAFLKLKGWRGIATRYAKRSSSFLAAVHIRCLVLWLNIL